MPCCTANCRTCRAPSSRRWISPVRRLVKYDIGSDNICRLRKSRIAVSSRTAAKASRYSCASDGGLHEEKRRAHAEQDGRRAGRCLFPRSPCRPPSAVKIGKSSWRNVTATASSMTCRKMVRNLRQEGQHPGQPRLALRRAGQRRSCNRKAPRNPTSFRSNSLRGILRRPERRIGHAHVGLGHVVEHHPVVAFPMHDRRQRHERQIAQRNLERARRQPELGRGPADRLQARAVGRGVTKLPNPCAGSPCGRNAGRSCRGWPRRNPSRRSARCARILRIRFFRFRK